MRHRVWRIVKHFHPSEWKIIMATLSQRYSAKESIGSDITTRKTFLVPLSEIYAEDGYNVRELNQVTLKSLGMRLLRGNIYHRWQLK